jgi:hypothetical protein
MSSILKHFLNNNSSSKSVKSSDVKSLRRKSEVVVREKTQLTESLSPKSSSSKINKQKILPNLVINVEDYDLLNNTIAEDDIELTNAKSNIRRHSVPETSASKSAIAQALDTILEVIYK